MNNFAHECCSCYIGLGTLTCSERATAQFEMEDEEIPPPLLDDNGQVVEQPQQPLHPVIPNLQAANPSMEAMRQELDAMRLSVATLVATATKTSAPSVSAGSMVARIQPFTGQDASVSAASWLASFRVKAYAKQLPAEHWVATALAALEDDPRSYVEQRLARLAE